MFLFITHPHRQRVTFACNSLETHVSQAVPVNRRRPVAALSGDQRHHVFGSCASSYATLGVSLRTHQRSLPSRDIVNVSTIRPRRTVIVRLETPYPSPLESYTAESRLAPKTIPYIARNGRR